MMHSMYFDYRMALVVKNEPKKSAVSASKMEKRFSVLLTCLPPSMTHSFTSLTCLDEKLLSELPEE